MFSAAVNFRSIHRRKPDSRLPCIGRRQSPRKWGMRRQRVRDTSLFSNFVVLKSECWVERWSHVFVGLHYQSHSHFWSVRPTLAPSVWVPVLSIKSSTTRSRFFILSTVQRTSINWITTRVECLCCEMGREAHREQWILDKTYRNEIITGSLSSRSMHKPLLVWCSL